MKNDWETIISLFQVMLFISVHSFVTSHPNKLKLCSLSRKQNVFVYLSNLWVLVFLSFLTCPLPDSISYSKHKHFIWLTFMLLFSISLLYQSDCVLIIRIHLTCQLLLPHSMLKHNDKNSQMLYCKEMKKLKLRPEEHHINCNCKEDWELFTSFVYPYCCHMTKERATQTQDSRWINSLSV